MIGNKRAIMCEYNRMTREITPGDIWESDNFIFEKSKTPGVVGVTGVRLSIYEELQIRCKENNSCVIKADDIFRLYRRQVSFKCGIENLKEGRVIKLIKDDVILEEYDENVIDKYDNKQSCYIYYYKNNLLGY